MKEHYRQAEFSLGLINYDPAVVEAAWEQMLEEENIPEDHNIRIEYAHYLWDHDQIISVVTTSEKTIRSEVQRRIVTWTTND